MIKKIVLATLIIGLTFINVKVYLQTGFPYTHDGENHLARFANYKIALKEGQLPPRFAPNLMNHYGYPVFNYNYPLANILSLPFSAIKINYQLTFKILVTIGFLFGLIGASKWLSQFKFSQKSKLFAISVFGLSPYILNSIVYRGNIGEVFSWSLVPWLLFLIEKRHHQKPIFIFILAGLLLSHNVMALFSVPFLVCYALITFQNSLQEWKKLASSFVLAILLSVWFWLPALAEKSQIIIDTASLSNDYLNHFPTLDQLLFAQLGFGFSYPVTIDSLSFRLGLIQISSLMVMLVITIKKLVIKPKQITKSDQKLLFLFGVCGLLFLFQLSITKPIWQIVPVVNYIQFPWRLGLFFSIAIAPIAGFIFDNQSRLYRTFLILILLVQVVIFSRVKAVDYFNKLNRDYDAFAQSTSTANENLPKTFTYLDLGDWQPTATIFEGEGQVEIRTWNGSSREYLLHLIESSTIVEPTMNFLGWQTIVTRQGSTSKTKVTYLNNQHIQGRIAYQLEPGDYLVQTRFTQNTWARQVGNLVSLATAISLFFIIFKRRISKR